MSDIHFMGSLVRGLKSIGSYLKKKDSNEYFHIIDEVILRNLKRLYPLSNLWKALSSLNFFFNRLDQKIDW